MALIQRGSGTGVMTANLNRGAYNPPATTPRGKRRQRPQPGPDFRYRNTRQRRNTYN